MPLIKRVIQPQWLCRVEVPEGLSDDLEFVANSSLARIIQQISSISLLAEDLFNELHRDTVQMFSRVESLVERVDKINEHVSQLDPMLEEHEELGLEKEKPVDHSTEYTVDQQLLSKENRPAALSVMYCHCQPIPALQLLDQFRDDERLSSTFYTDPGQFLQCWVHEMMTATDIERSKSLTLNGSQNGQRGSVDGSQSGQNGSQNGQNGSSEASGSYSGQHGSRNGSLTGEVNGHGQESGLGQSGQNGFSAVVSERSVLTNGYSTLSRHSHVGRKTSITDKPTNGMSVVCEPNNITAAVAAMNGAEPTDSLSISFNQDLNISAPQNNDTSDTMNHSDSFDLPPPPPALNTNDEPDVLPPPPSHSSIPPPPPQLLHSYGASFTARYTLLHNLAATSTAAATMLPNAATAMLPSANSTMLPLANSAMLSSANSAMLPSGASSMLPSASAMLPPTASSMLPSASPMLPNSGTSAMLSSATSLSTASRYPYVASDVYGRMNGTASTDHSTAMNGALSNYRMKHTLGVRSAGPQMGQYQMNQQQPRMSHYLPQQQQQLAYHQRSQQQQLLSQQLTQQQLAYQQQQQLAQQRYDVQAVMDAVFEKRRRALEDDSDEQLCNNWSDDEL